jgi:hypothetical protein
MNEIMTSLATDKIISLKQWVAKKRTNEINQQEILNKQLQCEQEISDDLEGDIILSGMLIW